MVPTTESEGTGNMRAPPSIWTLPIHIDIGTGLSRRDLAAKTLELERLLETARMEAASATDEREMYSTAYDRLAEAATMISPKTVAEQTVLELVGMVTEYLKGKRTDIDEVMIQRILPALEDEMDGKEAQVLVYKLAEDIVSQAARRAVPLYDKILEVSPVKQNKEIRYKALAGRIIATAHSISPTDKENTAKAAAQLLREDPSLKQVEYDLDKLEKAIEKHERDSETGEAAPEAYLLRASVLLRKVAQSGATEIPESDRDKILKAILSTTPTIDIVTTMLTIGDKYVAERKGNIAEIMYIGAITTYNNGLASSERGKLESTILDTGKRLRDSGNAAVSVAYFDAVIEHNPKNMHAHYFKGTVLENQGKLGAAKAEYVATGKGSSAKAGIDRVMEKITNMDREAKPATEAYVARDYEKCLREADSVLRANPGNIPATYWRGAALEALGNLWDADGEYRRVLAMWPEHLLAIDAAERTERLLKTTGPVV